MDAVFEEYDKEKIRKELKDVYNDYIIVLIFESGYIIYFSTGLQYVDQINDYFKTIVIHGFFHNDYNNECIFYPGKTLKLARAFAIKDIDQFDQVASKIVKFLARHKHLEFTDII